MKLVKILPIVYMLCLLAFCAFAGGRGGNTAKDKEPLRNIATKEISILSGIDTLSLNKQQFSKTGKVYPLRVIPIYNSSIWYPPRIGFWFCI